MAKTISAYDKEVSGDLYGSGSRYYKQEDDLANRRHLLPKNREQGFSGAEPYNSEGALPNVGQEGNSNRAVTRDECRAYLVWQHCFSPVCLTNLFSISWRRGGERYAPIDKT